MDSKDFQNKKDNLSHKVGDQIERLGKKITDVGAPKIGKAVYDAGNKIEHMQDEEQSESVSPSINKPI